jgi:predicted RNase H-like nuclease (RuvC/YqgF family)
MKKWRKQMDILKLKIISKKNYNKLIDELEKLKEKISSKQKSIRKLQEELRNFKDFYNIPYEEDFIKYKGKTKKIPIGSNFKKYRIKKERKGK